MSIFRIRWQHSCDAMPYYTTTISIFGSKRLFGWWHFFQSRSATNTTNCCQRLFAEDLRRGAHENRFLAGAPPFFKIVDLIIAFPRVCWWKTIKLKISNNWKFQARLAATRILGVTSRHKIPIFDPFSPHNKAINCTRQTWQVFMLHEFKNCTGTREKRKSKVFAYCQQCTVKPHIRSNLHEIPFKRIIGHVDDFDWWGRGLA